MYNKMEAGAICVIAKTLPQGLEGYRTAHPGELVVDRVVHHKGEIYPSYRIENAPKDNLGDPLWINGLFLDFVRFVWDKPVKDMAPVIFSDVAIGSSFKPSTSDCWHLKIEANKGMFQSFGTKYEPTFNGDQTVFID